jgi:hypothetical protein
MKRIILLYTLLCFIPMFVHAQVFPDSLKRTFIAGMGKKDTLVLYISRRSCFGGGFEKYAITRNRSGYCLTTWKRISLHELYERGVKFYQVIPDTLPFEPFKAYTLPDSCALAFARLEFFGKKCGMTPRRPGSAFAVYKMILGKRKKTFSNMCFQMGDIEDIAIPEGVRDDLEDVEEQ